MSVDQHLGPRSHAPREGERPLVGVLGGMGPAATADFYIKLIRRTPAEQDQGHLRVVIWADPTVPDRVAGILRRGEDPYPKLLEGAQHLRDLGVSIAAMPCNSAHFYLERLAGDTGLPFVDMISETVRAICAIAPPVTAVGLLGTRGLVGSGLYQKRLADKGIRVIEPNEREQVHVDQAIHAVKAGDPDTAEHLATMAASNLASRGSEWVILACTELPIALQRSLDSPGARLLDPTDVLARAIVQACRPGHGPSAMLPSDT